MGRTATASLHRAASANAASKSFVFGNVDNSNSVMAGGAENSRDALMGGQAAAAGEGGALGMG